MAEDLFCAVDVTVEEELPRGRLVFWLVKRVPGV
jgi:hypothetical protein